MKWYYKVAGGHTHVRVFMNGAKCGELCFRNEEFQQIRSSFPERQGLSGSPHQLIHFVDDGISSPASGSVAGPTIADAIAEYKATRGTSAVKLLHRVLDKIIGLRCPHCGEPVNITIESH